MLSLHHQRFYILFIEPTLRSYNERGAQQDTYPQGIGGERAVARERVCFYLAKVQNLRLVDTLA